MLLLFCSTPTCILCSLHILLKLCSAPGLCFCLRNPVHLILPCVLLCSPLVCILKLCPPDVFKRFYSHCFCSSLLVCLKRVCLKHVVLYLLVHTFWRFMSRPSNIAATNRLVRTPYATCHFAKYSHALFPRRVWNAYLSPPIMLLLFCSTPTCILCSLHILLKLCSAPGLCFCLRNPVHLILPCVLLCSPLVCILKLCPPDVFKRFYSHCFCSSLLVCLKRVCLKHVVLYLLVHTFWRFMSRPSNIAATNRLVRTPYATCHFAKYSQWPWLLS
mmetsp:Transcript_47479/g.79524  ORF Transcript_47479/g.79524 Transcript_47479/m.79524 type:complete len:273 (-) Transcript_47479:575-1393(-)